MARGDEGGRGRRWRGRLEGEGRNIGENREGGKEGKFPRAISAPIREGRRKTRGGREDKGLGRGEAYPMSTPR